MDNQRTSNATFDEIVFANRNKSYGAFLIRKLYNKNVFIALGISSFIFSVLLLIPLIKQWNTEVVVIKEEPKKVDTLSIIDIPLDPRTPPPPPLPEIEVPKIKTVKFVPLEVAPKDEDVREPDPKSQDELNKTTASTSDQDGKNDTTGTTMTTSTKGVLGGTGDSEEGDEIFYGQVGKEAAFPGGIKEYINANISERLKEFVKDREIHGTMVIFGVVSKDGTLSQLVIPKGKEIKNCKPCSDELIELVKNMPKWEPATSNGRPVTRRVFIPITF